MNPDYEIFFFNAHLLWHYIYKKYNIDRFNYSLWNYYFKDSFLYKFLILTLLDNEAELNVWGWAWIRILRRVRYNKQNSTRPDPDERLAHHATERKRRTRKKPKISRSVFESHTDHDVGGSHCRRRLNCRRPQHSHGDQHGRVESLLRRLNLHRPLLLPLQRTPQVLLQARLLPRSLRKFHLLKDLGWFRALFAESKMVIDCRICFAASS